MCALILLGCLTVLQRWSPSSFRQQQAKTVQSHSQTPYASGSFSRFDRQRFLVWHSTIVSRAILAIQDSQVTSCLGYLCSPYSRLPTSQNSTLVSMYQFSHFDIAAAYLWSPCSLSTANEQTYLSSTCVLQCPTFLVFINHIKANALSIRLK